MKERKTYVWTAKKQPFWAIIKGILRVFLKKPRIVNYNDEIPTDGILVGPHMWKKGPLYLSIFFPKKIAIMGASPMLGSYKERFHYLRDVFYIQKCHKKKFPSTLRAGFEAIFSKYMYKGMHLIPSYEDIRLMQTISDIKGTLDNGVPVVIFPEDSDKGYQLVMDRIHEGYITIVKFLNKKRQKDTPIYPYYFHPDRHLIVIGSPFYLSEFEGKKNEEIVEFTKEKINDLNPWLEEDKEHDPLYHKN